MSRYNDLRNEYLELRKSRNNDVRMNEIDKQLKKINASIGKWTIQVGNYKSNCLKN